MNVTLNGWDGEKFINDNFCTACGKLSTTIGYQIGYWKGLLDIKYCKNCLTGMIEQINEEILKSKSY